MVYMVTDSCSHHVMLDVSIIWLTTWPRRGGRWWQWGCQVNGCRETLVLVLATANTAATTNTAVAAVVNVTKAARPDHKVAVLKLLLLWWVIHHSFCTHNLRNEADDATHDKNLQLKCRNSFLWPTATK